MFAARIYVFFRELSPWLYGAAAVLLIVNSAFMTLTPSALDTEGIFYVPALPVFTAIWLLCLLALVISLLLIGLRAGRWERVRRVAGLAVLTVGLALVSLILLGTRLSDGIQHADSALLDGRIYRLAHPVPFTCRGGFVGAEALLCYDYLLYECDRLGVMCDVVDQEFNEPLRARLQIEDGAVLAVTDERVIMTYQP